MDYDSSKLSGLYQLDLNWCYDLSFTPYDNGYLKIVLDHTHELSYSGSEAAITETCECGHRETATLGLNENATRVYTGEEIAGLKVTYSEGWAGDKTLAINYTDNVEVGTTAKGEITYNNVTASKEFEITAKSLNDDDIKINLSPESENYNGTEIAKPDIKVSYGNLVLVKGEDYGITWEDDEIQDAGEYEVKIKGLNNFKDSKTAKFNVNTAEITNIKVEQQGTLIYNGENQKPAISASALTLNNQPLTFTYSLTENGEYGELPLLKEAGTHKIYYKVEAPNHETKLGNFNVVIEKSNNVWKTQPSIVGWKYGEKAKPPKFETTETNANVIISYSGTANDGSIYESSATAPEKAGTYTAKFEVVETANYSAQTTEVKFNINKTDYDMSKAKWNYSKNFTYDGLEKIVTVEGLPNGVTVEKYENNNAVDVGEFTAKATLKYDVYNYNEPIISDLEWKIENNWTPTEYTVEKPNDNNWYNKDFTIEANENYKISLTNTANGEWNDELVLSNEGKDNSITFYLKNNSTGEISLAKTLNYNLDKDTENSNSTGKVYFDERNGWQNFVNTITFDLFYKDEVTVKVNATDKLSEIDKIEYVESDKELSLDEVKALNTWKELSKDGVKVSLEDSKKFVYYIRLTDKAGNISFISSNGAEYDTFAPSITGVEDGKTYHSTQKIVVSDKNIESITLNEKVSTDTIILENNKEGTYTLVATDKAGNTNTVTIKMAKLDDIVDKDNVKTEDKQELENIKSELEQGLEENKDLYSDEEKTAIKDKIKEIDESLAIIENVEQVEDLINNLPETIKKGDKEEVEKAKSAYEELSDYEKSIIESSLKDKLEKAIITLEEVNNPQTSDNISLFMFMFAISVLGIFITSKKIKHSKK